MQQHVSTTLQARSRAGKVAHGYLLCGPRGVGKTTLARVLAMALNCERRVSAPGEGASNEALPREAGEPCGECDSCRRIWNGSASLDVVEIDAASNRGVDDARELRERAMYAPSGDDRYKVYIVDEAHMLTREAWNALLKILEEPPPRVVFVFATTEPQKIAQAAAPVLSRLQRFDFKRMGPVGDSSSVPAVGTVLTKENVQAVPAALALSARAADGSMRDALSLTDQVLSMGDGTLCAERVREALGLVAEDELVALLGVVAERRAADVFPFIGRLADAGVDFPGVPLQASGISSVRELAVVLGAEVPDLSDWTREALTERRGRQSAGDLVQILSALTELEPRFRKSGQQQLLIEASLVRLALLDRAVSVESSSRRWAARPESGNQGRAAARVEPAAKASPVAPEARQEGWQQSRPEPRQGSRPEPREDSRPEARPEPRQERQPVRPRPVASASAAPAAAMPAPAAAPAPVTASAAPGPLTALDVNRVASCLGLARRTTARGGKRSSPRRSRPCLSIDMPRR